MAQSTRASLVLTDISDATSVSTATTKHRRSHRKSRNGCIPCKDRHIRCDERRPACANCEIAERECRFPTLLAGKTKQKRGQRNRTKQHPEANSSASTLSIETTNHGYANDTDKTLTDKSSPAVAPQSDHSNAFPAPDKLSHRSLLPHHSLPAIGSHDVSRLQINSPASSLHLNDLQSPPATRHPGLANVSDAGLEAIFTSEHMILLYHAEKVPNFTVPNGSAVEIAIRHIAVAPYLIDEVLAFTAFHMTYLYPGSAVHLRHLATELQTRGLASFNRLTERTAPDDKATAVPRYLFSGILGRHVLCDTLTHCRSDFHSFIDRFVECITLNRGILAVAPPAWEYLNTTEIYPFLSLVREAENKISSPGPECDPLNHLMDVSDLKEASIETCRDAIKVLQSCFDLCRGLNENDYPQAVSAFSVKIDSTYLEILRKHQPEALVILAYYGVLLFYCRGFWAFCDSGASMIRAIADRLGSYWQAALAWPLHVIESERGS